MKPTPNPNWHPAHNLQHWIKHLLLPLLSLVLLLALPLPWHQQAPDDQTWIDIQLQPPTSRQVAAQKSNPEPEPKRELKPEPNQELKPEHKAEPRPTETVQRLTPHPNRQQPPDTATIPPEPTTNRPSAADVMLMMSQPPRVELSDEFLPRIGPPKDFYIPEQEIMDWFADIPYLDESVDQPQLTMHFYPEGIEGHVEKFFDKITISKTFTTRYGTKIHCAVIGIIAACGWK